jgi:osmoprotectant transport system substrate-binding protein
MEDDRKVQPVYAPTPIIREEVLRRHPEIEALLDPVFRGLSLETLQHLNGKIGIGGEPAATVAKEYLVGLGLLD